MLDLKEYDQLARSACFVCQIVKGKPLIPDVQVVYEDTTTIAFLGQLPAQEGYTIVCPKKHIERFEEMPTADWLTLQGVVQRVAKAVSSSTDAIRIYIASLGSPERNAHLHIHVCPCPPGTPFDQQQFAAMDIPPGKHLDLSPSHMEELAQMIRANMD